MAATTTTATALNVIRRDDNNKHTHTNIGVLSLEHWDPARGDGHHPRDDRSLSALARPVASAKEPRRWQLTSRGREGGGVVLCVTSGVLVVQTRCLQRSDALCNRTHIYKCGGPTDLVAAVSTRTEGPHAPCNGSVLHVSRVTFTGTHPAPHHNRFKRGKRTRHAYSIGRSAEWAAIVQRSERPTHYRHGVAPKDPRR